MKSINEIQWDFNNWADDLIDAYESMPESFGSVAVRAGKIFILQAAKAKLDKLIKQEVTKNYIKPMRRVSK